MGCHRTLDEIIDWSMLDDDAKRDVLVQVTNRAAARATVA